MRLLLKQYPIYRKQGLLIPSKIVVASSEFINQHNEDTNHFIETVIKPRIKVTGNEQDYIQFIAIKKWVNNHHGKSISCT